MKIFKKFIYIIIILHIFNSLFPKSEFEKLFNVTNDKRQRSDAIETDVLSEYMYNYLPNELGIEKKQLIHLTAPLTGSTYLSDINSIIIKKDDAIEDIHFLFQVLKYSYVGYSYFGGDNTWEMAKSDMINEITSYKEEITISELEQIILKNLSFVQDGHFTVNFVSPLNHYNFYYSEEFEIEKDRTGYYLNFENENYEIEAIDGNSNVELYIKPSINQNGNLCYYISFLSIDDKQNTLEITLKEKDRYKNITMKLYKSNSAFQKNITDVYDYSTIDNIPIFTIRSFGDIAELEDFMESAKQAHTEDMIILDIRGNRGGQDIVPFTWFQNFTGEIPQIQLTTIRLANLINNHITKSVAETLDYESLSEEFKQLFQEELQIANGKENKWYITEENKKFVHNKTKIFVLMDNKVASSSERFIQYLDTLENVVFIGTNTSGCYLSLQSIQCTLPHSQIVVTYGDTLNIVNDYIEGKGFEPDIWIGGNEVLERVKVFINNHN